MKKHHSLLFCALITIFANAKEPSLQPAETKKADPPKITRIDQHTIKIGKVTIHKKNRTISFPAIVNMNNNEIVEAAIVTPKGRTHESLLVADISAINLNTAFKLLSVPASGELFQILDKDFRPTGKFPEVSEATKKAARITIGLSWLENETKKSATLNDWVGYKSRKNPMKNGPWLYTGSYFIQGNFRAESSGDLVSIYSARPSLINYPGKDRSDDRVWFVRDKGVPRVHTKVTVCITLPSPPIKNSPPTSK